MWNSIAGVSVLLVAAVIGLDGQSPPPSAVQADEPVLYENARLIPGDGGPAIERSAILVEQRTIARVGRAGEVRAAASGRRVDLSGKTVMPALVATHVHPGFQQGLSYSAANYTRQTILSDRLSAPVYRAIIDEAHTRGLRVVAHVFYHADAVDLVDAGVDAFAHLVRDTVMDDALVAAIVRILRGV